MPLPFSFPFFRSAAAGGAVSGIRWLLRDEFTTDEALPLASPRTCEHGPGTLMLEQTNGGFSIVSSELVVPSPSPIGYPGIYAIDTTLRSRICGQCLALDAVFSSHVGDGMSFGFNDDTSPGSAPVSSYEAGVQCGTSTYLICNNLYATLPNAITNGQMRQLVCL